MLAQQDASQQLGAKLSVVSARKRKISVIVPMLNEETHVAELYRRLVATLEPLCSAFEIICVDDGSEDRTYALLQDLHERDGRVRALRLSRNFGKECAMSAGLDFCRGDLVVIIDADLQHPPECIAAMIGRLDEGYDVVYAVRRSRQGQALGRRLASDAFHALMHRVASVEIVDGSGDFRVMRRKVVLALRRFRESQRYMKGLFAWAGFRSTTVSFDQVARAGGDSRWPFLSLIRLALEALTSFSTFPLRAITYTGLLLGALTALTTLGMWIRGADLTSSRVIVLVVLFASSLQIVALGIVGEYVGRSYSETKRRPLYLVREALGHRGRWRD